MVAGQTELGWEATVGAGGTRSGVQLVVETNWLLGPVLVCRGTRHEGVVSTTKHPGRQVPVEGLGLGVKRHKLMTHLISNDCGVSFVVC